MKFKIAFLLSSQQPDGGLNIVEERGYETNKIIKTFPSLPLAYVSSNTLRGLAFMTSESCLLKPMAVAGNPSVTKLTHSSWT